MDDEDKIMVRYSMTWDFNSVQLLDHVGMLRLDFKTKKTENIDKWHFLKELIQNFPQERGGR